MAFETIQYAVDGPLGLIRLDRPHKLNAINAQMVSELNQALDLAESDERVRAIVLSGEGKAFSAGFDLDGGDEQQDTESLRRELTDDFNIIMRFWHSPKPTIAAVHAYCLGSAMEMAVACDITIAADGCRFGAPEVRFGSGIVALLLPWLCGPKKSKEWLLTGNDRITAEEAAEFGLVNRVTHADTLMDTAREIALQISRNDSLAVKMTKRAINRGYAIAGMEQALDEALQIDIEVESTETDESREFNRILKAEGTRAAIAWRDRKTEGNNNE
jgi:enoyl-CoA hydratase